MGSGSTLKAIIHKALYKSTFFTLLDQAMNGGHYDVFTMSRCPDVQCQHRHLFASHKYSTDFDKPINR